MKEKKRSGATSVRSLITVLVVAALMAVIPGVLFAWVSIEQVTEEVEAGRLRLAQLASAEADRIIAEAYFELEGLAQMLDFGSVQTGETLEIGPNGRLRVSSFHSAIVVVGPAGEIKAEQPVGRFGKRRLAQLATQVASGDRTVTEPWVDAVSGHVVVGLGVPVFHADGAAAGFVVGVVDLAEPLIADLVMPAARLGPTGHADLVDERGIVLASTEPGHVMTEGDHPDFYAEAGAGRVPIVANVAHDLDPHTLDRSPRHVMAYAPLRNAPWGVTMGSSEEESLAVVRRLQLRLLVAGITSAAVLALGIWFAARDLRATSDSPAESPSSPVP